MKSFEQFIHENARKYPGVLEKLKAEKKHRKSQKRERNRCALWSHGMRAFGPPI